MIKNIYEDFLPVEEAAGGLGVMERISGAAQPLIRWFEENQRILPWRQDPTPYHVWLSEIMLQQTRVEAVIPYYFRFLEALPGIPQLAEVEDETLMKLWQGLGYYNRARNLKKAAKAAVEMYDGKLPNNYEALLKMPGIGPYTAGAVGSIAYGLPVPAVDGNVLRVISRLIGSREDIAAAKTKKDMEGWIRELLTGNSDINPSSYNQALMELGALICIPNGAPHCETCPLAGICVAKLKNLTEEIPYKAPKKARRIEEKTVLVIKLVGADPGAEPDGKDRVVGEANAYDVTDQLYPRYMLCKRPNKGLLAGLYELPNVEGYLDEMQVREAVVSLLKGRLKENALVSEEISGNGPKETEVLSKLNCRIESVEEIGSGKHIFTHVEWHMKGYEVVVFAQFLKDFYDFQKIHQELAVPNAFSTFMKRIYEENHGK